MELVKHDLAKERPSRELLERLIDETRLADSVSTRSPAYKERGLNIDKMTKKQAIDLMLDEPNLMRRPLVLAGRKAVFGYDTEQYEELTDK